MTIDAILQKETLTHSDLVTLLGTTDAGQRKKLYDAAYAVKLKYIGNVDHYRGLFWASSLARLGPLGIFQSLYQELQILRHPPG